MYESEIRKALQGTILKDMSQEDLIETTSNLMSELYLVLGFKLPDSNTFSTIILHMGTAPAAENSRKSQERD